MQNLMSLWSALSVQRRMIVIGATAAMFFAIAMMGTVGSRPGMALLYAGLDNAASGEVIAALDQQGAIYEVRGSAIYVTEASRDALRMTLASQGLPATGSAGYELLDSLSGFGTTSQMFDAAYWRAKEGELARTIQANPSIRSARVHIATAPDNPFQSRISPTASVTVTTVSGGLPPEQAQALRHLVAAAVPGLLPKDVALIDSIGGLIHSEEGPGVMGATANDRAALLKANLERLLEARVGTGKAVVEVSLEVETESEQVRERVFDPASRVAISSETEERADSSSQPGNEVTVASNLPEGDAGATGGEQSQSSETRERVNYEVSETSREIIRNPGDTRKLSVAVLLDEITVTAADGTVSREPRSEEELAILRELVASAMGFDEARGDVLTVRSLAFQTIPDTMIGSEAVAPSWMTGIDLMQIIQIAVLAVVTLVLGLFVLRPVLASASSQRQRIGADAAPLALPGVTSEADSFNGGLGMGLNGEIQDGFGQFDFSSNALDLPSQADSDADPVNRLRRLIEERQTESIEILRNWMEKEEEKA